MGIARARCAALLAVLGLVAGCAARSGAEPDAAAADLARAADSLAADRAAAADRGPPGPTTVLRVHYALGARGSAISVRGAGGGLSWDQGAAAQPESASTWVYATTAIAGSVEWKPLVDDQTWARGPNYRVEPGQTVDVWPHFFETRGELRQLIPRFASQRLNNERTIWAYLPPTYRENEAARLPVVYMHDGQNLFDPALAFGGTEWRVDETLDAAAESGAIREAIAIGIENAGAQRLWEYTPSAGGRGGGGADAYLAMLVEELKPEVDRLLRTRPGREDTAIVGSSLGGLLSSYAGVKHGASFALVGALSPSTWWDEQLIVGLVAQAGKSAARVYLDAGDVDDGLAETRLLVAAYRAAGYVEGQELAFVVQAGASHNERYWAARLPGALAFLLGPGR